MNIIHRILTMFKAKRATYLDSMDNSIKILEKNIKELNDKKVKNSEYIAILLVNQNKSKEKLKLLEDKLKEWNTKVDNYIKHGDKNLAAEALKQLRELEIKFNSGKETYEKLTNDTEKLKTRLTEITLIIEQNKYKLDLLKARAEQVDIEEQLYTIDSNLRLKDFNSSYSNLDNKISKQEMILSAQKELDESIYNKLDDKLFKISISEELEEREQRLKKK